MLVVGGVVVRIYFVLGVIYCVRTCLVWRTRELYPGVVVAVHDEINVGGWCYCTHYFVLGPIYCVRTCLVRRTWGLSYLGVVAVAAAAVVIDVFSTLLCTW